MVMEKEVTWTKDWPGANRHGKSISADRHFGCQEIEESRTLDIRTQGVLKPEITVWEKFTVVPKAMYR
jgi:hypothetical protein